MVAVGVDVGVDVRVGVDVEVGVLVLVGVFVGDVPPMTLQPVSDAAPAVDQIANARMRYWRRGT